MCVSALRGPRRTSKGRMVVTAAGYASLMLMAAATKRSVAAAAGWLRKEGRSGVVASAFAMRSEYQ